MLIEYYNVNKEWWRTLALWNCLISRRCQTCFRFAGSKCNRCLILESSVACDDLFRNISGHGYFRGNFPSCVVKNIRPAASVIHPPSSLSTRASDPLPSVKNSNRSNAQKMRCARYRYWNTHASTTTSGEINWLLSRLLDCLSCLQLTGALSHSDCLSLIVETHASLPFRFSSEQFDKPKVQELLMVSQRL